MSHLLDRLTFFRRIEGEFADGHGIATNEDRRWEDGYRKRWQHDKIVRSTHGANCTGSCSWKIYVKGGIVTWETQQTDYPRTRPELPNHEPRGCSRGASYSWYLYSGNRLKYPLVRARLIRLWRQARAVRTPVAAWASIVEDPEKRKAYTAERGLGGFVRAAWDEVTEIIAAANAYTAKTYGPDRVIGFSPIPAMSMVSYAAGARYLSLLGGVCMSLLRLVLRPAAGLADDLGRADRRAGIGRLVQFELPHSVGLERAADAHARCPLLHRGALSRRQERRHLPGLLGGVQIRRSVAVGEAGHRRGARHGHGPRHPQGVPRRPAGRLFHRLRPPIHRHADARPPGREGRAPACRSASCAPPISPENLGETNNPEWKPVAFDEASGKIVVPRGSVGFRWGEKGKWNLEEKESSGRDARLRLSLAGGQTGRGRLSLLRQCRACPLHRHRPSRRAQAQRAGRVGDAEGRRGAGCHRLRPVPGQLRRRPRLRRRASAAIL